MVRTEPLLNMKRSNPLQKAPQCVVFGCGKPCSYVYLNNDGTPKYRNFCNKHHRMKTPLLLTKKDYCENIDGRLGFQCTSTINSSSQLDLDHIDGDRYNNSHNNLQTLCKNCHASKTYKNGDHLNRYNRPRSTMFDQLFS